MNPASKQKKGDSGERRRSERGARQSKRAGLQRFFERDADFDRAKVAVTGIIIRDRLTVRVYKSADFAKSPATSLLEVWEKGQRTREETYKLYFD